ncbi:MAG TPA: FAD-dependent oxidoreductase [Allosphingosinicella sp.]|nr:FAD-dependent oxidoreductase [Allosphingosinicella sp.]
MIGGGPAGVFAAIEAKRTDPAAAVTLLTDEACEPYEKPPLSKAVLTGKALPEHAPIAGRGGTAAHSVVLAHTALCTAIDRAAREVVTAAGERYRYDALVLATGSLVRELPQLPLGMERVHYLRTEADARALAAALRQCRHLVVVGGGLIGLEAAASAAELGVRTTVLEVAPRILARVCDEETSAFIAAEHRSRGIDLRTGTTITAVRAAADAIAITTASGETIAADLVVVGTGVKPNDTLAAAAGLAADQGIVVDEQCRTSDPAIFAAGDAVRFPAPHGLVRLENWRHAQDQGVVAGRNAAGRSEAYHPVPSFWSEQYDLYIQGVGWPPPQPDERIRRPLPGKSLLVFDIAGGMLVYAMGINAQRDLAAARRLIERRIKLDPAALADPGRPLASLLKASV